MATTTMATSPVGATVSSWTHTGLLLLLAVFVIGAVEVQGIIPARALFETGGGNTVHQDEVAMEITPQGTMTRLLEDAEMKSTSKDFGPSFVHPSVCLHLSDEDCRQLDGQMLAQADKTKKLVQQSGNLKVLVLLVDWASDDTATARASSTQQAAASAKALISTEDLNKLFNAEMRSTLVPSGSLASFMRINSYGKLHMEATVIPWKTSHMPETFFANEVHGLPRSQLKFSESTQSNRMGDAILPILNEMDTNGFDWTEFDQDGDGVLDSVVLLHSGHGAEFGSPSCVPPDQARDRIWSHSLQLSERQAWKSSDSNYRLGTFTVSSAYDGACGNNMAKIGLLAHELLHTMGLPDLFDADGPLDTLSGAVGGAGSYDIMSNPFGASMNPSYPGFLSAWSKARLGWLEPQVIQYSGAYAVHAAASSDQVFKVTHGYPEGEYLLIENRQPILFDVGMQRSGGILIWHIDDSMPDIRRNGMRGFPGLSLAANATGASALSWPSNGHHYRVALLQADGNYDLERAVNNGDAGDFWMEGRDLGPGKQTNQKTVRYPNTDSYQNGVIEATGVFIGNFSKSGTIMEFNVGGLPEDPTPPKEEDPPRIPNKEEDKPALESSQDDTEPTDKGKPTNEAPSTPSSSSSSLSWKMMGTFSMLLCCSMSLLMGSFFQ